MNAADLVAYMEKAERSLQAAHLLHREHDLEGVCNRAYYAMSMPPMLRFCCSRRPAISNTRRIAGWARPAAGMWSWRATWTRTAGVRSTRSNASASYRIISAIRRRLTELNWP